MTFDLHTPSTLSSPTVQTPSEYSLYSVDAEPDPPALDSVDVDSPVSRELSANEGRGSRRSHKCRDLPDSESEEEEEDSDVLRPNCRGRWFTCLGADYGSKDYKWYGIHPRLGMRYGQLDETQQKLYEDLGPDYEHEEAALTLLEKAKSKGLERVKPETFKGMMVQCKATKKWKLGVRRCARPAGTYSNMKSHLLTTMHAPIGYECPDCHATILQESDVKRHLEESHSYEDLPGSLEEIRKALNLPRRKAPRRKAPRVKVSQHPGSAPHNSQVAPNPSSGSVVVDNYHTVKVNPPSTHALTHPRQQNTAHHSRWAPYGMDARPVRVTRQREIPQPVPQSLGPEYDPPVVPPYNTLLGALPPPPPPAPVWALQDQHSRSTIPGQPPEAYDIAHDPPYFTPASQLSNSNYVDQPLAPNKEYFNTFSEATLRHSHMSQPPTMGSEYPRVATNTVNNLPAVPSVMYTSALQSAGYPMYIQNSWSAYAGYS
ncbi:hypothetical protein PIIN_02355 [Serendipita indica DSM 11827]|uniref:C2H2-type domain-containing protein n=1 Tax=Serendipita indica (strain DSM 11827) TaxID=1109443 RepID=G4TAZ8_SERID|nr:hypothetical protein PIIN_02355 [Serendipita indica DSM 11827]